LATRNAQFPLTCSRLESGRQNSRLLWPQDNDGKVHRADVERAVEEHKLGGVRARATGRTTALERDLISEDHIQLYYRHDAHMMLI